MGFSDIFRSNQFKQTTEGQPPNNIDEDDNGSVQGAETNNNEDNSELLAAVKEKINSQFIEPKKPEPLNMDISIPELKILHYLNYIFDKDNPLPFYLNSYSDVFENLNKNGYFAEPTPETFLNEKIKVADLKNYLKTNDLPVSGNKAKLVERIIQNVDKNKLKTDFNLEMYRCLSNNGLEVIKKYPKHFLDKSEFFYIVEIIYNRLNKNILLDHLDFAAEDIKFLDDYKDYDLPIKAFTLVYDEIASLTFNKGSNSYFESYTQIFYELYCVTIPYNVFMQVKNYYHSFKKLNREKNNRLCQTYKIQTMEDARTCSFCKEMSNKEFSYSDAKIGINYPPFYNCKGNFCRCYAESIFDESSLEN